MAEFQLGDRVIYGAEVGTVVGLRMTKSHNVKVRLNSGKRGWCNPGVLKPYVSTPENAVADKLIEITNGMLIAQQYREIEQLIKDQREEAYDEGYEDCQESYGDGPSQ